MLARRGPTRRPQATSTEPGLDPHRAHAPRSSATSHLIRSRAAAHADFSAVLTCEAATHVKPTRIKSERRLRRQCGWRGFCEGARLASTASSEKKVPAPSHEGERRELLWSFRGLADCGAQTGTHWGTQCVLEKQVERDELARIHAEALTQLCTDSIPRQRNFEIHTTHKVIHPHHEWAQAHDDRSRGTWQLWHQSKLATKLCIGEAVDVNSHCNCDGGRGRSRVDARPSSPSQVSGASFFWETVFRGLRITLRNALKSILGGCGSK